MPMSPQQFLSSSASAPSLVPPPLKGIDSDEEIMDRSIQDISPRFLTGADPNLTHGLQLLKENLNKLLPNQMLRSSKYRSQVDNLLGELTRHAQYVHDMSVTKNALLKRSIDDKSTAEASELRCRKSVLKLGLNDWGNLDSLKADIASIEREIIERGRFTAEDPNAISVGLQFGIETGDAKAEAALKEKLRTRQQSQRSTRDECIVGEGAEFDADIPNSTHQLVYLKFRRLDELISVLKRRLSTLENYPHRSLIDRKYGSLDGLLAHCDRLEKENLRLESRLSGKYREDALLKPRNLIACSTPFLHLLIVALQQTLQAYMSVVDELSVGKEFTNAKHPLYNLIRSWSAEVDRDRKKHDIQSASSINASAASANRKALSLDSAAAKLDIDELYQRMVEKANEQKDTMTQSSSNAANGTKVMRASAANSSAPQSSSSSSSALPSDLPSSLHSASLTISSLTAENDLLKKELENYRWMARVLNKEGINQHNKTTKETVRGGHSDVTDNDERVESNQEQTNPCPSSEEKEEPISLGVDHDDTDGAPSFTVDTRSLSNLSLSSEGDSNPPTVLRANADSSTDFNRVPVDDGAGMPLRHVADSSPRVSRVSRNLLRHLHASSGEVARYRAFLNDYHRLHADREAALDTATREKQQLLRIMMHILKKYPHLYDANTAIAGARQTHANANANTTPATTQKYSRAPLQSSSSTTESPVYNDPLAAAAPGTRNMTRRGSVNKPPPNA